jgi:hypothetical protein
MRASESGCHPQWVSEPGDCHHQAVLRSALETSFETGSEGIPIQLPAHTAFCTGSHCASLPVTFASFRNSHTTHGMCFKH